MEIINWNISIKTIFANHRFAFCCKYWINIRDSTYESINKLINCWSKDIGFTTYSCSDCWEYKHIPFTCKSRFCNSCWVPLSDKRLNNLVSWRPQHIQYFHLAFTIPEELRDFFKKHRSALKLLQRTASDTILYFFQEKYNIKPWILSVIHTFWAQLNRNPHVHVMITAWGITSSNTFKNISFIPYYWFIASWKKWILRNLKIRIKKYLKPQKQHHWISIINFLYRQVDDNWKLKSWYIYFSKRADSFKVVLKYIWRYLKRPVIAQSRILDYDWENIIFKYKDKYDNTDKTITCSVFDFIKLLTQHIPKKFARLIFYSGIFANRYKSKYLKLLNPNFKPFPKNFRHRSILLTWKDPLICSCWGLFHIISITISWYPTKYFDDS